VSQWGNPSFVMTWTLFCSIWVVVCAANCDAGLDRVVDFNYIHQLKECDTSLSPIAVGGDPN
jgi:hypothetical protein